MAEVRNIFLPSSQTQTLPIQNFEQSIYLSSFSFTIFLFHSFLCSASSQAVLSMFLEVITTEQIKGGGGRRESKASERVSLSLKCRLNLDKFSFSS